MNQSVLPPSSQAVLCRSAINTSLLHRRELGFAIRSVRGQSHRTREDREETEVFGDAYRIHFVAGGGRYAVDEVCRKDGISDTTY
jgi:hypothetical protein